jgi:hypothetical protein
MNLTSSIANLTNLSREPVLKPGFTKWGRQIESFLRAYVTLYQPENRASTSYTKATWTCPAIEIRNQSKMPSTTVAKKPAKQGKQAKTKAKVSKAKKQAKKQANEKKQAKKQRFYAVAKGNSVGVFTSLWFLRNFIPKWKSRISEVCARFPTAREQDVQDTRRRSQVYLSICCGAQRCRIFGPWKSKE